LVVVGVQVRLATLEGFPDGQTPQLDFEIRVPAQAATPSRQGLNFEMQAGSQRSGGLLRDEWLRRDGERSVLVGFVPLYTRTSQRILVVSRPGEPKLIFHIRLSATPTASERYGEWQPVDFIDDAKAAAQARAKSRDPLPRADWTNRPWRSSATGRLKPLRHHLIISATHASAKAASLMWYGNSLIVLVGNSV
jgi:hypothetical protein